MEAVELESQTNAYQSLLQGSPANVVYEQLACEPLVVEVLLQYVLAPLAQFPAEPLTGVILLVEHIVKKYDSPLSSIAVALKLTALPIAVGTVAVLAVFSFGKPVGAVLLNAGGVLPTVTCVVIVSVSAV